MTALLVDVVRVASGWEALGFLNLAFVWLAAQQLGFFLADGAIDALSRRSRITIAGFSSALLALSFATGFYSSDLIANLNPPTTALLLVGVIHTMLFSLCRAHLTAWSIRPRAKAFAALVNARAITVYLWHMTVLLTMAGASALLALRTNVDLPEPSSAAWWLTRPLWVVAALGLTAVITAPLARFETVGVGPTNESRHRISLSVLCGLLAVVTLLTAGTSPLTSAIAVALLLAALRMTRHHHEGRRHAQRR